MAKLRDADSTVRLAKARDARHSLIQVGTLLGARVQTRDFNQLILFLGVGDEDSLDEAARLWSGVERALMSALSEPDGIAAPAARGKHRRVRIVRT
jgi:hypothetical protein